MRSSQLILALGCALLVSAAKPSKEVQSLPRSWKALPTNARYREDGEGPYAAYWPTYAVAVAHKPHPKFHSVHLDATVFLLASPDANDRNLVDLIPSAARFAIPTYSDCRGHWVLVDEDTPLFILTAWCGGSAGDAVSVYKQDVFYALNKNDDQVHQFKEVFSEVSVKLRVLAGDIDGKGTYAVLTGRPETMDGANNSHYDVYKWKDSKFVKTEPIKVEDAASNKRLREQ